jgi:hypothetical protein
MAGIRFQTTVYSYNSWSYFIQIWDRNYTGSTITEITLGQGGPQINWDSDNDDRFSTIMSSSCEIPIMVEGTLLENWLKNVRDSYEEKDVYVHIYRNTQATASSLIWSGFLLMDLNSTVDEFFPYEFKLTFTDGLSLLKEVDFVETGATKPYDSSEMLWGPASYSFWMKTVLGKVGAALTTEGAITDWEWRTSINWYNTGHGASAPSTLTFDPFAKTEVQVSMFHNEENDGVYQPQNCYDVLNQLLKHWGARIVYWRHKFWIIQIPEYNTAETGTLANPDNINTRKYFHSSNSVSDAFDNLNDYWTPYQVFLQASGVIGPSKIVGTKYDFKAPIKEVIAKYITGSGENYFGGFPTSENTVVTQERINNLADASGIYLDIPLIFTQDRSSVNSGLTGGQFSSFSADIRYQLAATNLAHGGSTTKFLHYNYATNTYSWNTTAPSSVNNRPRWYASNLNFTSGSTGLITQQLGGPDNGSAVLIPTDSSFTGLFDITIQIFNFVNGQASSKYAFIDNDTGANWADPRDIGLTWENVASVSGTTLSSSSYMSGPIRIRTYFQPNGNPFAGQLLALGANLQVSATAQNIVQDSNNTNNSSIRNFDELLWGDSPASVSRGAIQVVDTSGTRTTTVTSGQWGVGVTNGTQTFSKLLLDRFLEGQLTSIRVANFRLVIPTDAKTKDDGTAVRPQYINPVGLLVENRPQEAPMSYVMQRGTFHVLMDEWDFQGFEIQSESTSASTVTVTDSRGGAIDIPVNTAPPSFLQRPPSSSINSAARNNIITTLTTAVSGLGSDLVANGNYDELGSELATNGNFDTSIPIGNVGSYWTVATGSAEYHLGGAKLIADNSNICRLRMVFVNGGTQILPLEKTFKITYTVLEKNNIAENGLVVYMAGNNHILSTNLGTHTFFLDSSNNSNKILQFQNNTFNSNITIDNVSVKQVDPDDDWTKGTGWSIQDDQAQFSGSADAALEQESVFTSESKYKVSIDIAELSGGELQVKDDSSVHQTITSAGGYEFTFTATGTTLQLNIVTGSAERTVKINSITAQEVSSTTSLAINSIGEAIFTTGNKFSLLNINNNTTYDLTINANQSANDTTLTITAFEFEAIVPVGSIVTFNKKNLIKEYQDDTLQEVTDNGNTTTNSIMIGSSSAPSEKLHVTGDALITGDVMADTYKPAASNNPIKFKNSSSNELARITDGGTLLVNTTSVTHTNNPESLRVFHNNTDTTNSSSAVVIDANISGSSAIGGDTEHAGLNIDLDSSATGGDTSDEHRVRGIKAITTVEGDSDQVYGILTTTIANHSSGTVSALRGIMNFVKPQNTGNYNGVIGGYDFVQLNNSSVPNISSVTGARGDIQINGFTNTVTTAYGGFFKIDNHSGGGTISTARGVYSEIEIDSGTISNARVFEAVVDINGGTLTNSYMYRGNISGSPSSDNFGLYLIGVAKNRVDGFLGVGKTPSVPLDVFSDENIIARFNSSDSVCQLQISDDDTTFYFGVLDGVAFISDTAGGPASGLTVDGSGNVGISNSSPSYALDVSGKIQTSDRLLSNQLQARTSFGMVFKNSAGSDLMFMSNSGNFGIGLTNPETKLDVNGTCTSELLQLKRQESAPSDPEEDRSIIYMDSSGDIKVKINVGGETVTRTLATYA